MVAFTTYTLPSAGSTRALSGGAVGAGIVIRSPMVVLIGSFRLTSCVSGSVPTFTDQRSTPQVGLVTVSVMGAVVLRSCASEIVATMLLEPVDVDGATV